MRAQTPSIAVDRILQPEHKCKHTVCISKQLSCLTFTQVLSCGQSTPMVDTSGIADTSGTAPPGYMYAHTTFRRYCSWSDPWWWFPTNPLPDSSPRSGQTQWGSVCRGRETETARGWWSRTSVVGMQRGVSCVMSAPWAWMFRDGYHPGDKDAGSRTVVAVRIAQGMWGRLSMRMYTVV